LAITCDKDHNTCQYNTGQDVIDSLDFHVDQFWWRFGVMCALPIVYRLIAFLVLLLKPVQPDLS
jgi:hypothetical protein